MSYHHRGDQAFKEALVRVYCDQYELLEDNSLERVLDTDDLKYVEREIREDYIRGASAAIMLCGAETFNRKFVDWEIYATLLKRAALVGVRLPGCRALPWRLFDNALTGYAVMGDWDDLVGSSLPLRAWIELALARDAGLIDNSRPKMRANGERRVHPLYGLTTVDRLKHLELIQAVVTRVAGNSFLLRGWSVTLVGALLAVSAKETQVLFAALAVFPTVAFAILDVYYLRQERMFRGLYDKVRHASEADLSADPYTLSTKGIRCPVLEAVIRPVILIAHLPIFATIGIVIALLW